MYPGAQGKLPPLNPTRDTVTRFCILILVDNRPFFPTICYYVLCMHIRMNTETQHMHTNFHHGNILFMITLQYIVDKVTYDSHKTTLTCLTKSTCPTIITCTFAYKPKPGIVSSFIRSTQFCTF